MCEDWNIWIFGYGSLIWRPGFNYIRKVNCFVKGWKRRFWQGSTDHRGVPGSPGRVVTLVQDPEATTWGVAYCITEVEARTVLANLDYREKGGYVRDIVDVFIQNEAPAIKGVVLYSATETNPDYLGPAPLEDMAKQIATARGPSGPNIDYLLNLAVSMRDMGVEDTHVIELEEAVLAYRKHMQTEHGDSGCVSRDVVTAGNISIDDGAVQAICQKGKLLLAAGVTGVKGDFEKHSAVLVCDQYGNSIARGRTQFSSREINQIRGRQSSEVYQLFSYDAARQQEILRGQTIKACECKPNDSPPRNGKKEECNSCRSLAIIVVYDMALV